MISDGYLRRHIAQYQGSGDARIVGLLDVVQTYVLEALRRRGYFEKGLIFKGGTALRKYFLGSSGRFSTDLDFVIGQRSDLGEEILLFLSEGSKLYDVEFHVSLEDNRRGRLQATSPLGSIQIASLVEFSDRGAWLPPDKLKPLDFIFHQGLEFEPQEIPILNLPEILAEKLAAIWRRGHARDLYDLALLGRRGLNEQLIRRLMILKIYTDVEEGISKGPYDPVEFLSDRIDSVSGWDDLGLLSAESDPDSLIREVRARYRFITNLDEVEATVSLTSRSDKALVGRCIDEINEDFPRQ